MKQLEKFLRHVGSAGLVLHDAASADAVTARDPDWEVYPIGTPLPDRQRWAGVALVVADREALRRVAIALPHLGRTRAIACLLTDDDQPAHLTPRPEWPFVTRLTARSLASGGATTVLHLQEPFPAHAVFRELARTAGTSLPAPSWILLESPGHRRRFNLPPEIVVPSDGSVAASDYDPDVAPAPVVVNEPALACGPLDEGVINPIGFHSEHDLGIATLDASQPMSARTIAGLRAHQGVRVDWEQATPELARSVAGLAMAGIPLVGGPPPVDTRPWLGEALFGALTGDADIIDPLRREEHSVRLRRAALLTHSGPGWGSRVAEAAGRARPRFPTCSVVIATRRPHQLDFALKQVSRQRGLDIELVVAAHGFEPDLRQVHELLPGRAVEVVSLPPDTLFGDVLNAGVAASSGDIVVKMDDDDYYGPDFLLDLFLAREYSGADVVGTPAEFVHLEDLNLTVRRAGTPRDGSERFANLVAGGTITIRRELLAAVGGFSPVHRFVDQQLFHAVTSVGATIYRGHGLGFMLRRASDGHTWPVGDEHFLDTERLQAQWDGFVPTRILEPDDLEKA